MGNLPPHHVRYHGHGVPAIAAPAAAGLVAIAPAPSSRVAGRTKWQPQRRRYRLAPRATSARRPQRQLAHDLSRVPQQRANERARIEPDPASPTAAGHGTSRLFSSRDSSTGEAGVCPSCHAQPHRLFRRPHAMVAGSTPIPLYCRAIRLRKI